jgi:hypothetical protein
VLLIIIGGLALAFVLNTGSFFLKNRARNWYHVVYIAVLLLTAFDLLAVTYASYYEAAGLYDNLRRHEVHEVSTSLYFSVVTLTTLGFGDVVPTESARAVAASEAVFGYLILAGLIGGFGRLAHTISVLVWGPPLDAKGREYDDITDGYS